MQKESTVSVLKGYNLNYLVGQIIIISNLLIYIVLLWRIASECFDGCKGPLYIIWLTVIQPLHWSHKGPSTNPTTVCSIRKVSKVVSFQTMKNIVLRVEFILKVIPDVGHFVMYSNFKAYVTFITCFSHTQLDFNLQEMTNIAQSLKVNFLKIDHHQLVLCPNKY